MPLMVIESLIQSVMPCRNVPTPRVTISEWIRNTMMKKPLTRPVTSPMPSAARIASSIGMPRLTFRTASIIEASVSTLATDRSKSPAVSGMMRPRVATTSTACEPRIVAKLAQDRNASGRMAPKTTMSAAQAIRSPKRSS